jgi:hypothetical protein
MMPSGNKNLLRVIDGGKTGTNIFLLLFYSSDNNYFSNYPDSIYVRAENNSIRFVSFGGWRDDMEAISINWRMVL